MGQKRAACADKVGSQEVEGEGQLFTPLTLLSCRSWWAFFSQTHYAIQSRNQFGTASSWPASLMPDKQTLGGRLLIWLQAMSLFGEQGALAQAPTGTGLLPIIVGLFADWLGSSKTDPALVTSRSRFQMDRISHTSARFTSAAPP